MRKVAKKRTSKTGIIVTVARFGSDPQNVSVKKGATVEDVLDEANINLEGREELFVDGDKASDNDVMENGDILSIVTPKSAAY